MNASPSSSRIASAVRRLREGGVVAFPTETVYGLGADARNQDAVRRVFAIKGRPSNNPLIVHVADIEAAKRVCSAWPMQAQALAERFWPGPLTLVLPKSPLIPDLVTAGSPTVAVRVPDHPIALELLRAFDGPLVGPSANLSGCVSPTTAEHVREYFDEAQVLTLDGGPCAQGIESTVCTLGDATAPPRILRQGFISAEELSKTLGIQVKVAASSTSAQDTPLQSPGLLARHYAPSANARLIESTDLAELIDAQGGPIVLLTHEPGAITDQNVTLIPMPTDPQRYAAALYSALRDADSRHPNLILILRPSAPGSLWDAIRDRLSRATTER